MGKYVIKPAKSGGFSFSLKAGNGEVIGTSEVYTTLDAAKNGCASVGKNALKANLEDQTVEGFEQPKHPKFQIYLDKAGEFRFRLLASNGENVLRSEGYTTKAGCKNGISSVVRNAESDVTVQEEA